MGKIEKELEELGFYVCDELCKHRAEANQEGTDEAQEKLLNEACPKCRLCEWL